MSIIQLLGQLDGGFFLGKATDAQHELVRAISDTGKGGKLIIEINIKPATRSSAMVVRGNIKLTKPAEPPLETIMFGTEDGDLLANDPRQVQLDLRVIPEQDANPQTLKTA